MKILTLWRYKCQVASAFAPYIASCHHEQLCLPAQEFWLLSDPGQEGCTKITASQSRSAPMGYKQLPEH